MSLTPDGSTNLTRRKAGVPRIVHRDYGWVDTIGGYFALSLITTGLAVLITVDSAWLQTIGGVAALTGIILVWRLRRRLGTATADELHKL